MTAEKTTATGVLGDESQTQIRLTRVDERLKSIDERLDSINEALTHRSKTTAAVLGLASKLVETGQLKWIILGLAIVVAGGAGMSLTEFVDLKQASGFAAGEPAPPHSTTREPAPAAPSERDP